MTRGDHDFLAKNALKYFEIKEAFEALKDHLGKWLRERIFVSRGDISFEQRSKKKGPDVWDGDYDLSFGGNLKPELGPIRSLYAGVWFDQGELHPYVWAEPSKSTDLKSLVDEFARKMPADSQTTFPKMKVTDTSKKDGGKGLFLSYESGDAPASLDELGQLLERLIARFFKIIDDLRK